MSTKKNTKGSKVKFTPNKIVTNPSAAAKSGGKTACGCKK
jgi:hypothetical protein